MGGRGQGAPVGGWEGPRSSCRWVGGAEELLQCCGLLSLSSAGVGRSGTFIAIDILLQHIKDHAYINVRDILYRLRDQRMKMVQSVVSVGCVPLTTSP